MLHMKSKALLILFALTIALVPLGIGTHAKGEGGHAGVGVFTGQKKPVVGKRRRVVEPNERHFELNKNGEKRREYGSGQEIPAECDEIHCPNKIKNEGRGKSIRCWRCGQD
jgi:hypothetical protein